ncbi:DJ-1/PfpI family protein [Patescibacteria group bacterium]|nr:DJ-1/PfpI family protein [Patescibacteria group bacterium]
MRLIGKKLLLLVTDGVDEEEFDELKEGFEAERAEVLVTTPQEFITVETVKEGKRGKDIEVDLPFEMVDSQQFDGLIIPDGLISAELLRKDMRVLNLVFMFNQQKLPIFASGSAVDVLYDSQVLSNSILIREGTPMSQFLSQAVGILLDRVAPAQAYRPTITA